MIIFISIHLVILNSSANRHSNLRKWNNRHMYIYIYMYDVYISSKYFKQPKEKILLAPIYIICLPRIKLLLSKLSMEWEKKFNTNSIPAINSKHFCFARNEASLNFATKFYFSFDIFFFFFHSLFVFPWNVLPFDEHDHRITSFSNDPISFLRPLTHA